MGLAKEYEMTDNKPPSATSLLFRATSCVAEPLSSAIFSLKSGDLRRFTDIVNNIGEEEARPHWINQPIQDEDGKSLLLAAVELRQQHFVDVLLRGGAGAHVYSQELGKYPVHAAAEVGSLACLRLLLEAGGDVNAVNRAGRTVLHVAVERSDVDMVDYLLKHKGIEIDIKDKRGGGLTPLYLAVKQKSPQLVEMLVEAGASLDSLAFNKTLRQHIRHQLPDLDLEAAVRSPRRRAPLIKQASTSVLERLAQIVDRAALGKERTQTLEDEEEEFQSLLLHLEAKTLNSWRSGGLTLLQKCCSAGLDNFADSLLGEGVDPNYCPEESLSPPVLLAAYSARAGVLAVLDKHNADFTVLKKQTQETVLHRLLLREPSSADVAAAAGRRFEASLAFLLATTDGRLAGQMDKIINKKDLHGNTALHYATQKWSQDVVRQLLERGANIGIKNRWGEVPINKILPDTMEDFLNQFCLQSAKDVNHEDFQLSFRYQFLAPPVDNLPVELQGPYTQEMEEQSAYSKSIQERYALPETESLWYMGQSREHRHLLKHPVITSFLWLKWTRIRRYFNRNLRFYALFVFILTWFVFEEFGGQSLRSEDGSIHFWYGLFIAFSLGMLLFIIRDWITDIKDLGKQDLIMEQAGRKGRPTRRSCAGLVLTSWPEVGYLAGLAIILFQGASSLYVALLILLSGLALRELFQMAVSLRRYVLDLENWAELGMIALICTILLAPDTDNKDMKRHLAAISLFLSWAELITFVAKHPRLTIYNVYVTMFYKVLQTFFLFLLWYLFFILAFGLGFYIMLHKDMETQTNTTLDGTEQEHQQERKEEEYKFFDNPWLALVKTCAMFVGELEFSNIPIDLESRMAPLSYIFFLAFLFLIVVVLMNLLNGLAVSDTGRIQEKSEIVAYLSRVHTISYAESLLLGDPFDFLSSWPRLNWLTSVPSLSCCRQFYKNKVARRIFQRLTGATGILLFYNYLPNKQLVLKPNKPRENCLEQEALPRDILDSARLIILEREEKDRRRRNKGELAEEVEEGDVAKMASFEEHMVARMARLEEKLDAISQYLLAKK